MITLHRIVAKFPGRCAASGEHFAAGRTILHHAEARKCYLPGCEPEGATIVEPVAGSQSAAYRAGWAAGAPGSPMTSNPHPAKTPENKMWTDGLRDRHASGT